MQRLEINVSTGDQVLVALTAEEIAALPTPVSPTIPPISPRQIRMALTRAGLRSQVETAVTAGTQDLKDWWEFSTSFERNNPQVLGMCNLLGVSDVQCDGLWALGATL